MQTITIKNVPTVKFNVVKPYKFVKLSKKDTNLNKDYSFMFGDFSKLKPLF